MTDQWILVPLDAGTNEVFARSLANICRADETMETQEGPGYIVPADLFPDQDGDPQPSVFLKKIENSVGKFNLRYSLYRVKDKGKPQKWNFSFTGRGKKRQAVKKQINKMSRPKQPGKGCER